MANIVIFGGDGFIGRHLVKTLAAAGPGDNIKVFSRFSAYRTGGGHPFDELDNVSIIIGDFLNRDDVAMSLKDADYVFHLISTTNPASSSNDPLIEIETNLRCTVELLEACVANGVKKVIYLSSGGTVYGDVDSKIISEDTLPQPRSPYGISKLAIEHYLRYFKYGYGLDYVVYRVANPYGPGQNIYGKQGVIPIFLRSFLDGEPIKVYGDGSMVRDYIYIEDLANMIAGSYNKSGKEEVYNLGSGRGHTVNELINAIEDCTELTVKRVTQPTPQTFVDKSVLNIDRFTSEFGLSPSTNLHEGIERTWEYVKQLS